VTDYRDLNKVTIKNYYPLPRIEDLLDKIQGDKFFTKMDLTIRCHQVHMHVNDMWKTTFKTKFGLFEWMVISFGIINALTTFIRFINYISYASRKKCFDLP